MQKQNIRTLSLVVITLTYLIFGAALFDRFESGNEAFRHRELNSNISAFKKKHNMTDTEFNILWNNILMKKPHGNWKFIGSLYFCTVVVTLIGYGHRYLVILFGFIFNFLSYSTTNSTPKTVAGKSFCIFYTLIGIPVFLIMFQSVGERLNSIIVFLLSKVKKKLKFKNQDIDMFELITVEFILTLTIVFFASYIFVKNENWSYFDSIYYCLITLLTIGFGDLVPMQKNNALSNDFTYVSFTILFILTGLTTLASSMNLLVLRLATINAEEQVQIKLQAAEAQAQRCYLDGDIINHRKLFKVDEEMPDKAIEDNVSVCSCACLDNDNPFRCKICCFNTKTNSNKNVPKIKVKKNKITNDNETNNKSFAFFYESSIVKRLGSNKRNNANRQQPLNLSNNTTNKSNNNIEMIVNNTINEKEFSIIRLNKAANSSSFSVKSIEF